MLGSICCLIPRIRLLSIQYSLTVVAHATGIIYPEISIPSMFIYDTSRSIVTQSQLQGGRWPKRAHNLRMRTAACRYFRISMLPCNQYAWLNSSHSPHDYSFGHRGYTRLIRPCLKFAKKICSQHWHWGPESAQSSVLPDCLASPLLSTITG